MRAGAGWVAWAIRSLRLLGVLIILLSVWLTITPPVDDAAPRVPGKVAAEIRRPVWLPLNVRRLTILRLSRLTGLRSDVLTAAARRTAWEAAARKAAWEALHEIFWLHGEGTQLYTAWNAPITLKFINWYGFEYSPFVPGGLNKAPLDSILALLHKLGFNGLRILFANETVEGDPVVWKGLDANPELRGHHALDIMSLIITHAHRYGLRVILCNSRSEAGMGPELRSGLWYTRRYPESSWVADWVKLVTRFKDKSAFVGADLRNEPHIPGSTFDLNTYFQQGPLWGAFNGTYYHDRDWHYAAETLGNTLLKIDPHLLIIVEGIQMYFDPYKNKLIGALWGSNLEGVHYDPIQLSDPHQLVYSVHEYGPKMWLGRWFSARTTYHRLAKRWTHLWGYLLSAPKFMQAPIFVGEFGTCDDWHACISDPHKPWSQGFWWASFTTYMKAHPQIGWAYWSLNPEGPFRLEDNNFYSLMFHDWHRYHTRVTQGLASLLAEPNG